MNNVMKTGAMTATVNASVSMMSEYVRKKNATNRKCGGVRMKAKENGMRGKSVKGNVMTGNYVRFGNGVNVSDGNGNNENNGNDGSVSVSAMSEYVKKMNDTNGKCAGAIMKAKDSGMSGRSVNGIAITVHYVILRLF
jgi:hypothetical protein